MHIVCSCEVNLGLSTVPRLRSTKKKNEKLYKMKLLILIFFTNEYGTGNHTLVSSHLHYELLQKKLTYFVSCLNFNKIHFTCTISLLENTLRVVLK